MNKRQMLYEGKGKKLFATDNPNEVITEFKDDLTAYNAQKKGSEKGKGALNCKISAALFELLESREIATHFIKTLDENTMLCKKARIIPIEVVTRNVAAGSLCKRLGILEGECLPFALVEFFYKDDALGDPLINDEHCKLLNISTNEENEFLREQARKINEILKDFFIAKDLRLIDFKLEFGRDSSGNILLCDEISPDNCRFWDRQSNQKLDKDRFREGIGEVKVAYEEVLRRILR